MTDQQQPQFTIAELSAKFAFPLGQAYSEIITLEKLVEAFQAKIQEMTNHENLLVENIQDLEMELDQRKADFSEIDIELVELKRSTSNVAGLSPALAEIAAEGKAVLDDVGTNEKAALG